MYGVGTEYVWSTTELGMDYLQSKLPGEANDL